MFYTFIQRALCYVVNWVTFPIGYCLFVLWRYRIAGFRRHRRVFRELMRSRGEKPILICMNHLTRVDSVILLKALAPPWKYFFQFSWLPWHIYDRNVVPSRLCRTLLYLNKCISIWNLGPRKTMAKTMGRIKHLLRLGELVVLFPEGERSTTGYMNQTEIHYGVGEILATLPGCQVLCVYLRPKLHRNRNMPIFRSEFDLAMEIIKPKTTQNGLRAVRDLSRQVIQHLCFMEASYFESRK